MYYPTVPFLSEKDLRTGKEAVQSLSHKYIFTVSEFPAPVQRALKKSNKGIVKPLDPKNEILRTQDLITTYFDAGQFYWAHKSTWKSNPNVHLGGKVIVIPKWRSVDIDDEEDWIRAEKLYKISDLS